MKKITSKMVSLVLVVLITGVSITTISSFKKDTRKFSVEKYSGTDLFNSLIFIKGDHLTQQIPDCKMIHSFLNTVYTKNQITYFYLNEDRIISIINQKHPDFFKNFKMNIISGDPIKIDSALTKADEFIHLYSNSKKGNSSFPAVGTDFPMVIDFDIVTAANAPETPETVVIENTAGTELMQTQLNREEYVSQIAEFFDKHE